MSRLLPSLFALSLMAGTSVARAQAAPAAPAPAKSPAAAPAAPQGAATNAVDRSGVVVVEQAGRVLGLGTILNDDGRIVTAFSRTGHTWAGPLSVRYADGSVVTARIGHTDKDRDLALLVPKVLRVRKGVQASRAGAPAAGATLNGFANGPNRTVTGAERRVQSAAPSAGRVVLALSPVPKATDLGAPLLDARGQAVAIVVSGCLGPPGVPPSAAPQPGEAGTGTTQPGGAATTATPSPPKNAGQAKGAEACPFDPVGMPVAEIRAFLRALPAEAAPVTPWLGIDGVSADTGVVRGIRVGRVEPNSPSAGLELQVSTESVPGDLLVAVAGTPVPTPEALEAALRAHAPGERVELLIFDKNGYRTATVRLAERPKASQ